MLVLGGSAAAKAGLLLDEDVLLAELMLEGIVRALDIGEARG